MLDILNLVSSDGMELKRVASTHGNEYAGPCPVCGGKDRFRAWPDREDGKRRVWMCRGCDKGGDEIEYLRHVRGMSFAEAKQALGMETTGGTIRPAFQKKDYNAPQEDHVQQAHRALLDNQEALGYLSGRGITRESVIRFRLGLRQRNGTAWLAIPHFVGDKAVNVKFRSLPPAEKAFERILDCRSVLFNSGATRGRKEIIVTEGEIDAITLLQAGFDNVVGATNGAASFEPEWIDQLQKAGKIFICYDPDEAGQKGARNLAKRLGYNRCYNMTLPEGQDVNNLFVAGGDKATFENLLAKARKFDLPGVIQLEAAVDLLRVEREGGKESAGLLTPWPDINRLTRGFHPGDLIILSAPPKIGKTTLALNIAHDLSLKMVPVLFYCLEMRPERLAKKIIQGQYQQEYLTPEIIDHAASILADKPLYLGYSYRKQKLDDVLDLIREAIKRYDLRLVIFDNLHFLIRSISNVNEELGQAVQGFKLLAEEMEIPIMAIAQPRKLDVGGRDEIMRADDIKYSNAVHADCDQMILLHRKRVASKSKDINPNDFMGKTEALDPVTLVRIEAHRYGSGGEALLYFHGEYSRFDNLAESREIPY